MTTAYTATVDITTPSVTLTDFTCVVPANIGVNVYGAALNTDINTFDIGPTGGTNLLLQTLAVGSHHIHDGVCHDSATGTIPPDSGLGVHGIYDKAAGTLVENMEFYNHPHGQACSVRYGNAYKSNLYHDTPYSLAAFNYQGAALGPAGTPRFRDCIFYNLPAGGYVFYSDGLWRESNGTLLGNSLFSIEIDHCTIDIRGMTNPFDFSQCHNDVYLTNCVVISDSGLPLSSIITPPLDSSTVHLDGSIVLSSADAATYLGPAPTFTPIAVGGSPVIGTAVASPPVSFAQWGNEGDVGATQTGSSPPGPPPLPGPSIPTLSTPTVVGSASAGSTDTLVIPITVAVPRTDPSLGATFVFVFYQLDNASTSTIQTVTDDAPVDDDYSLCLFADGLNHYDPNTGPVAGLIVNPLIDGVNSITLTFDTPTALIQAVAIAITGLGAPISWGFPPFDPSVSWWPGVLLQDPGAEAPVGAPTTISTGVQWTYATPTNDVEIVTPAGAVTDENWDWANGQFALYWVAQSAKASDPGAWTWADGTITSLANWHSDTGLGGGQAFMWEAIGYGAVTPTLAGPSVAGALDDASSLFGAGGDALAFVAGAGPAPCGTPPGTGVPVFNNHIRLSE